MEFSKNTNATEGFLKEQEEERRKRRKKKGPHIVLTLRKLETDINAGGKDIYYYKVDMIF